MIKISPHIKVMFKFFFPGELGLVVVVGDGGLICFSKPGAGLVNQCTFKKNIQYCEKLDEQT